MSSSSSPLPASPTHLLPLDRWAAPARSALIGVFTDIDDTLTTDGAITADALQALGDLKAAGFAIVAITGRPVGWSLPFVNTWPVDAIVAENGAVALAARARRADRKALPAGCAHARRQLRAHAGGAGAHRARDSGCAARHRFGGPRDRHRHRPQRVRAVGARRPSRTSSR
jgi:hypothetical protein